MQLRNDENRFGLIAVSFHWLVALLFFAMVAIGLAMTNLPLTHPLTFPLYQLHKSIGATIFVLVALRLAWRLASPVPPLPSEMPVWERRAAQLAHWGLYALLLLLPLVGWVIVSASPLGIPTVLYGVVRLPHIGFIAASPDKEAIGKVASTVHATLAWSAVGLVTLHAGAALRHHFWLKDGILGRMLPSRALFLRGHDRKGG